MENFFAELENTTPYFKCALQGMAGTGKTFTAAQIAAGLWNRIGSDKPIIIFDTEKSAKFLKPMFAKAGVKVLVKQSRTLPDLMKTMQLCSDGEADILLIDSITHVYEQFLSDYQKRKGRSRLYFQDWGEIKPTWKREFSTRLVNSDCHIIFTGREGFTYDHIEDQKGNVEIVKSGVKMKAEGETAYEPDLLLRMERFEELLDHDKHVWREATVVKDRSDLLDGRTFKDPSYEDFAPVIEFLLDDPREAVETVSHPNDDLIRDEEDGRKERQESKILWERIQKGVDKVAAGRTVESITLRASLLEYAFYGETSETAMENCSVDQLTAAMERLAPLANAVAKVQKAEDRVYPVVKAKESARIKYLGTTNLGEHEIDKLDAYYQHMQEKDG